MKRLLLRVARRIGGAVLAAYGVVTVVFLFVALTPDPNLEHMIHQATMGQPGNTTAAIQEIRRTYAATRGLDQPLYVRYGDWLWRVTTLQWGQSYTQGAPVTTLLAGAARHTLRYVLPALVISTLGSTLVALYSGARRNPVVDRLVSVVGYFGFGLPNFVLGTVLVVVFFTGQTLRGDVSPLRYGLAALVLTTTLLAGQIHYFRAEIHEHLDAKYVTVLRAKGVSRLRLLKHVLRNATLPLLSLFFSDLVAVLMLHVFVVEAVFGIPGVGQLTLLAVQQRDMPLILGVTMLVVFVGIAGHLLEDLAAYSLDPRTRSEER